jgi:hypothetical protein
MMAGGTFCANPGVAVKANAENATANTVAIFPIVSITLSDKSEALVYFEMSIVVVVAEALAMKLLRVLRDIEIPATQTVLRQCYSCFRNDVC